MDTLREVLVVDVVEVHQEWIRTKQVIFLEPFILLDLIIFRKAHKPQDFVISLLQG
jgi:hypothetical protein